MTGKPPVSRAVKKGYCQVSSPLMMWSTMSITVPPQSIFSNAGICRFNAESAVLILFSLTFLYALVTIACAMGTIKQDIFVGIVYYFVLIISC